MGAGVILLLYYISPIIYAERITVMNPDVHDAVAYALAKAAAKEDPPQSNECVVKPDLKKHLKPHSEKVKFSLTEIRCGLVWLDEIPRIPRRQKFWNELVPELMQWLSAEAIECGIYWIYTKASRSEWINALHATTYTHLKAVAVVQHNITFKSTPNKAYEWLQTLTTFGNLNWLKKWPEAYEFWYTSYEYEESFQDSLSPLKYLQIVFLKSIDMVIRGLLEYMGYMKYETLPTKLEHVPKSPRRPMVMMWPSVMQPAVAKDVDEKLQTLTKEQRALWYMKIVCDNKSRSVITPFSMREVELAIYKGDEERKAPIFYGKFVPELIQWLSAQAIECGFYTIFPKQREQIYRFIEANRDKWIKAVQELVYMLLQVIAVIQHKTNSFGSILQRWLERWVETFEKWYTSYSDARSYLELTIVNSFDIVMAWLFDYLTLRATNTYVESPFWKYPSGHSYYFPGFSASFEGFETWEKKNKWNLSDDDDIVCALENHEMKDYYKPPRWYYMIDVVKNKLQIMAEYFLTCRVHSGCEFERTVEIYIGVKDSEKIVRLPYPQECEHFCKDLPDYSDLPQMEYSKRFVSNEFVNYRFLILASAHAHMTTAAGYDLSCDYGTVSLYNDVKKVSMDCHPMVVERYITERLYMICKSQSCKDDCCKTSTTHCETVSLNLNLEDFKISENITLTQAYPNNDSTNAKP